ncbi:MAG: hypothetical protein KIS78_10065 [Labilithrix sp.]|nr:hypothetical protein [Labilithrix sp.]MCW5832743.1 hypothetical protein [Labilithrix sp.]
MSRMIVVSFVFLSGCGSCVEDKKESASPPVPSTILTVTKTTEAGTRPILVRDPVNHADILLDAGTR